MLAPLSYFAAPLSNIYLGCMLNWGLYGALSVQVYLYYLAFPEDRVLNKTLVYGVYILETLQAILMLTAIVKIPIYGHGGLHYMKSHPQVMDMIIYGLWIAIPLLGGLVAFIVQSFYAYRLCILARSLVIMIFIILFAFAQFAMSILGAGLLFPGSSLPIFQLAWATISILCDIIIAIAMIYFLLRNDSGWKSTHTLLVKLVRLAVETGAVTMVVSICLVVFTVMNLSWDYVPAFVLGKIYSNTMMANFNHRILIINGRDDTQSTSFMMPPSNPDRVDS